MDFPVKLDSTCSCGRAKAPATGFCDLCIKEGSQALWAYIKDKLTHAEFMSYITGDMTFMSVMRRIRKAGGTETDLKP